MHGGDVLAAKALSLEGKKDRLGSRAGSARAPIHETLLYDKELSQEDEGVLSADERAVLEQAHAIMTRVHDTLNRNL